MKTSYFAALAIALLATPAVAQPTAETTAKASAVSRGAMIFSSEGGRIGRVDRIREDAVNVIYKGKVIAIPTASLTAGERGFTSSLTRAQIGKL